MSSALDFIKGSNAKPSGGASQKTSTTSALNFIQSSATRQPTQQQVVQKTKPIGNINIVQPQNTTQPNQNIFQKLGSVVSNIFAKAKAQPLVQTGIESAKTYAKDTTNDAIKAVKGAGKLTPAYMAYRAATGKPVTAQEYLNNALDFGLGTISVNWRLSPEAPVVGAVLNAMKTVRQKKQGKVTWDDIITAGISPGAPVIKAVLTNPKEAIEGIAKQPGIGEVFTDNVKVAQAIDTVFLASMFVAPIAKKQISQIVSNSKDFLKRIEPLGVKPTATMEEVSQAVRAKMKQYPDAFTLNPSQEAMQARVAITDALNAFKEAGVLDKKFAAAYEFLSGKVGIDIPSTGITREIKQLGDGTPLPRQEVAQNGGQLASKTDIVPASGQSRGVEDTINQKLLEEANKRGYNDKNPLANIENVKDELMKDHSAFASTANELINKYKKLVDTGKINAKDKSLLEILSPEDKKIYQDALQKSDYAEKLLMKSSKPKEVKLKNFSYTEQPGLTPEERIVERRFADYIDKNKEKVFQDYDKKFGKVINTDNFRELSSDYESNRQKFSKAVHEPASSLAKEALTRALKKPDTTGENTVLITAGGTGAGKTTAIQKTPEGKQIWDDSSIIYDTNLNNASSAIKKIDQMLKAKKRVVIAFVARDPVEAFRNGVIPRTERIGRTVPVDTHIGTHLDMQKSIPELIQHYRNETNVIFKGIDNSLGKGNQKIVPIDSLLGKVYNKDEIQKGIYDAINEAYTKGNVSDEAYKGFSGQNPPQRTSRPDGSGNGEKPSETRQVNTNKESQSPVGQGKLRESTAYKKIKSRISEEAQLDVNYNKVNLNDDIEKAVNFVESNPKEAIKVSLGLEDAPKGQLERNITIATAEKALADGDIELWNQIESSGSLRQTRRGQEIAADRGRFTDNSPHTFMKELLSRRLTKLGISFKDIMKDATGKVMSAKEAAVKKIDERTKVLKEKLMKDQSKIKKAQDIIDMLRC